MSELLWQFIGTTCSEWTLIFYPLSLLPWSTQVFLGRATPPHCVEALSWVGLNCLQCRGWSWIGIDQSGHPLTVAFYRLIHACAAVPRSLLLCTRNSVSSWLRDVTESMWNNLSGKLALESWGKAELDIMEKGKTKKTRKTRIMFLTELHLKPALTLIFTVMWVPFGF